MNHKETLNLLFFVTFISYLVLVMLNIIIKPIKIYVCGYVLF